MSNVYTDQPIFDAIAAATQIDTHPDGFPRVGMSARIFIEVFNNHRDRALCTSLDQQGLLHAIEVLETLKLPQTDGAA